MCFFGAGPAAGVAAVAVAHVAGAAGHRRPPVQADPGRAVPAPFCVAEIPNHEARHPSCRIAYGRRVGNHAPGAVSATIKA